jgi:hypothetical protein
MRGEECNEERMKCSVGRCRCACDVRDECDVVRDLSKHRLIPRMHGMDS